MSDLLNGDKLKGVIKNGQNLEGVKICIMQVKAYEVKYGKENIPTVISTFKYKNGKLTLVEDPELPQKANAISKSPPVFFDQSLRLLYQNPQVYYDSMTKK